MINKMRPKMLILHLFLLAALLIAALFSSRPALAAYNVSSVDPNTISNLAPAEITVYGSGFQRGAYVVLSDGTFLETSYINSEMLAAVVPAGLWVGIYNLTVVNADGEMASLIPALTITEDDIPAEPFLLNQETLSPEPPGLQPTNRPLIIVRSYGANTETVTPGSEFSLTIRLENIGNQIAHNLVANFTPSEFIPLKSGGVLAVTEIEPYDSHKFVQPMRATYDLVGKYTGMAVMNVSYTGEGGLTYSETFNLSLPVTQYYGPARATATGTPTGTALPRPQVIITNYTTDIVMLKPGTRFKLGLQAQNKGNGTANQVSMILGGGSSSGGNEGGTQVPGGVSGGSGDFGKFAPVDASNVQFIGDMNTGERITAEADLIVNSTTEPGAYPLKISFSYTSDSGNVYTDDQVITLLVYSPPIVGVSFYQDPGVFFVGQPGPLPLQVTNLGRKQVVLGSMIVTGDSGQFSQNTTLVGPLDPGGYFTLDAMVVPDTPGTLNLLISIDYTDDFNAPQVITKTLTVEVMEAAPMEPGMEGGTPGAEGPAGPGMEPGMGGEGIPPGSSEPETFWQGLLRFVRGMLGLDSGSSPGTVSPDQVPPGEMPPEEVPVKPVPAGKG